MARGQNRTDNKPGETASSLDYEELLSVQGHTVAIQASEATC